ncbi:MAG: hypothetical protein KGD60_15110 [Candidatus Thorarchaeota archaeon]|nr:hypothetical protein [Candidatus Thorarchaeota archaeon]
MDVRSKQYTVIDRLMSSCFKTDNPKEAYQEACRIEEKGHDYAIKDNQLNQYVSRLSVYLAY